MHTHLAFEMSTKMINSLIIIFVIGLVYLGFLFWIKPKELDAKTKYKKRFWYASGIILTYFIGKIWMEGFVHLFAFLGIISAALTITQKETLMNLVGWFIIMWRDHFSEGDRIEIATYKGYVHSIGVFYFTLSDEYTHHRHTPMGKTFRIPNGLVITSPITNHMRKYQSIEYKLSFLMTSNSSIDTAITLVKETMSQILQSQYVKNDDKEKKPTAYCETSVYVKPKFDEPSGIELICCYYCLPKDQLAIEKQSYKIILEKIQQEKAIELAFAPVHNIILQKGIEFEELHTKKLMNFQHSVNK